MSPARRTPAAHQRRTARAAALAARGTPRGVPGADPVGAADPADLNPGTAQRSARVTDELVLELPDEPHDLRRLALERYAGGGGWPAALDAPSPGAYLWQHWGPTLAVAGVDDARFAEVADGYRRELWLWVAGERQWAEVVTALAGRVGRRLPAPR